MRIRIFGDIATGKTTLAKNIALEFKTPIFSTDDFVYSDKYVKKRPIKEREKIVGKTVHKKDWIIEGVHHSGWVKTVADHADLIIILKASRIKLVYRIIKRTFFEERGIKKFRTMLNLGYMLFRDSKNDSKAYERIAKSKNCLIGSEISIEDIKRALKAHKF